MRNVYSQEVADSVLLLLADGKSLRAASAQSGVAHSTVLEWVDNNPEFADQYTRTRARAYELLADELVEISDEKEVEASYQGEYVRLDLSASAIARNRLRVDTRKWMLSKMLPKVYGDKQTIELNDITPLTPEQTDKRIAELMAKAAAKAP